MAVVRALKSSLSATAGGKGGAEIRPKRCTPAGRRVAAAGAALPAGAACAASDAPVTGQNKTQQFNWGQRLAKFFSDTAESRVSFVSKRGVHTLHCSGKQSNTPLLRTRERGCEVLV